MEHIRSPGVLGFHGYQRVRGEFGKLIFLGGKEIGYGIRGIVRKTDWAGQRRVHGGEPAAVRRKCAEAKRTVLEERGRYSVMSVGELDESSRSIGIYLVGAGAVTGKVQRPAPGNEILYLCGNRHHQPV